MVIYKQNDAEERRQSFEANIYKPARSLDHGTVMPEKSLMSRHAPIRDFVLLCIIARVNKAHGVRKILIKVTMVVDAVRLKPC